MLFPWIGLGFVAHRRVHYISVNSGNPPCLPVTSASLRASVINYSCSHTHVTS